MTETDLFDIPAMSASFSEVVRQVLAPLPTEMVFAALREIEDACDLSEYSDDELTDMIDLCFSLVIARAVQAEMELRASRAVAEPLETI